MHFKRIATTAFQCSNSMFMARSSNLIHKASTLLARPSTSAYASAIGANQNVINMFRGGTTTATGTTSTTSKSALSSAASSSLADIASDEAREAAKKFGYSDFESWLTTGGDDRSLILEHSGANKYHIKPQAIDDTHIFRG